MSKKTKQITEVPRQQSWNNAPSDYTPVDEAKLSELIEVAERITNLFQSGQYGQVINASREVKKRFAALQFGMDNSLANQQHMRAAVSFFNRCYGDVSQIVESAEQFLVNAKPTIKHGPIPPMWFYWHGERKGELTRLTWLLAKALWNRETPTIEDIISEVWGDENDVTDQNFKVHLSRLNHAYFGFGIRLNYHVKAGHVIND